MLRRTRTLLLFLVGMTIPLETATFFSVGGFFASASKVAGALLVALAGLQLVFGPRRVPRDRLNVWVVLFAVSLAVSFAFSIVSGIPASSLVVGGITYVSLILLFFLVGFTVTDASNLDTLLWGFVIGATISAGAACVGLGHGRTSSGGVHFVRYSGFSSNPNLLGYTIASALPVAAMFLFERRSSLRRLISAGSLALIMGGIVLSQSRSAFLTVLTMGGFWVLMFRRFDTLRYLIPVVFLVAVGMFAAPQTYQQRVSTIFNPEKRQQDSSIQMHIMVDEKALQAFASNPLLGVGLGRFGAWAHRQDWRIEAVHVIHSSYLQVAAEQGLIGLAPYSMMLLLAWRDFARARRVARRGRALEDPELIGLGTRAGFLQIALAGTLIGNFFAPSSTYKAQWLVLGLAPAVFELVRRRAAGREPASEPVVIGAQADRGLPPVPVAGH
jgi:O-antigen ligase